MSSSDSDDDCYGNIAQKLQTIKNKFITEKVDSVLNDSEVSLPTSPTKLNTSEVIVEDCNVTVNSTDNDEFTLDAIIANNAKQKRVSGRARGRGRGAKRKTTDDTFEPPSEPLKRSSRRRTANSTGRRTSPVSNQCSATAPALVEQNSTEPISTSRGNSHSPGSNRGAAAGSPSSRGRGRGRSRGRGRRGYWSSISHHFDSIFNDYIAPPMSSNSYPTYSVGNTDEYPDDCDNQQLFASKPVNDVEVIEDNDPLEDDNEEMSVKVYWQSLEVFKFKIRKYQKLTQIFDYFAEKEGVSKDKLLFTYNERILKIDDTPDSIGYSIAKFIDGGIVSQNVTDLVKENINSIVNSGLKIKFQCQNVKKHFETTLRPDDKLALAMMRCAEHLEKPIERLKFYFDGDLISSKNTPQDLELEGGECIDVKICS